MSFLVVMKECKAKRCSSFKINFCSKLFRTLSTATSKESFASAAAMLDPYEQTTSFRLSHSTRHRLSVPPRSVIGYQIFANSCERNRSICQNVWQIAGATMTQVLPLVRVNRNIVVSGAEGKTKQKKKAPFRRHLTRGDAVK